MTKQERIVKLSKEGLKAKEIAKRVGCHMSYVYISLKRDAKQPETKPAEAVPSTKFWVNSVEQLIADIEMELAKKEQEARELSHFLARLKERVDAASV